MFYLSEVSPETFCLCTIVNYIPLATEENQRFLPSRLPVLQEEEEEEKEEVGNVEGVGFAAAESQHSC